MGIFKKTGQERVSAIVGKVSSIVDELNDGVKEIDAQLCLNDIQRAQLDQDTKDLTHSKKQASTLAKKLSALTGG